MQWVKNPHGEEITWATFYHLSFFLQGSQKVSGKLGGNKREKQQQKSPHFLVIESFQTSYHSNFYFLVFLLSYSNNFKFVMLEGDANIKLKMK